MNIRCSHMLFCAVVTAVLISLSPGLGETSVEYTSLFRYSGDGVLPLVNTFSGEEINVTYRDAKGNYDEAALATIDRLLACHNKQEEIPISLKLIELIDYLQDHFGSKEIEVVSGYRTPEYNVQLRRRNHHVARQSMHLQGRAMDIKLPNVNSRMLRNYAISLKSGGVGYYGARRFVHIDTGPVRTW